MALVFSVILAIMGIIMIFVSNRANIEKKLSFGLIIAFLSGLSFGLLGFFSKLAVLKHSAIKLTSYQIIISIFSYLDKLFSIVLAALFLNQKPTFYQILGGFFIILAGVAVSLKETGLFFTIKK